VATRSPELVRRTKQVLRETTGYASAQQAAAVELQAQQWSVGQPYFEQTIKALRAKTGSRPQQE
jgi:enoyl-CoA hydratase